MKKRVPTILLIVLLLAGVSLLLYPTISDYWNSFHVSQAVAVYAQDVEKLDQAQYDQIWRKAKDYNTALLKRPNLISLSEEEKEVYKGLLDVNGTGIMGSIEIPKIHLSLPIYHGTDEAVLQIAVGHLEWTSLPVGGPGTHCVLSGHRGLPSAKLFTNLDQMEIGDQFELHVLDELLTYEVDQILVVEPADVSALTIEAGKDLCTLVTCTPYGVNSHRLLVRGRRVENAGERPAIRVTSDAVQIEPLLAAPLMALPLLLIVLLLLLLGGKRNKPNGGKKRAEIE